MFAYLIEKKEEFCYACSESGKKQVMARSETVQTVIKFMKYFG